MKKIFSFVFALMLAFGIFALGACGETPAVPTDTTATTEATTASTQGGASFSPPVNAQPIAVNSADEFFDVLENRKILENEQGDNLEAYKLMFEQLSSMNVIPYPTVNGVPAEKPDNYFFSVFVPEVRAEDAGLYYKMQYDGAVYFVKFYKYDPYFEKELDESVLSYEIARFGNIELAEDRCVKATFMGKECDVYYANDYFEVKISEIQTYRYFQNIICLKYDDMIVKLTISTDKLEETDYNQLIDFLENHLGFVDVYSLKE